MRPTSPIDVYDRAGARAQVFRQTDVAKAIRATVSTGLSVQRVEIDRDGRIVVVIGKPDVDAANDNEWDLVE